MSHVKSRAFIWRTLRLILGILSLAFGLFGLIAPIIPGWLFIILGAALILGKPLPPWLTPWKRSPARRAHDTLGDKNNPTLERGAEPRTESPPLSDINRGSLVRGKKPPEPKTPSS